MLGYGMMMARYGHRTVRTVYRSYFPLIRKRLYIEDIRARGRGQTARHGHGHGTARHGTARHGTARHGTARHGTARHGTARHGTTRHGTARHGTARHGTARHGTARHGTARIHSKCAVKMISPYLRIGDENVKLPKIKLK
ncbi:hypothetical protein QZH41_010190 [Actinostola sp. cb2023]|nr:hypothetical protein QZH41_010190 [Actinostola sp. cb2023]